VRIDKVVVAADAADRKTGAVGEQPKNIQRIVPSLEHLNLLPR
jgi:hypothetical protein